MLKKPSHALGFTLIEVLLALVIIAIGMTSLLKAVGFTIQTSSRLQEKFIAHVIGMNAVAALQMTENLANTTQSTVMMGQKWYWRAVVKRTPVRAMQQITVSIAQHQAGPFNQQLIAYRYAP